MLLFRLNAEVLAETARAMRGCSSAPVSLSLNRLRSVPLELYGRPVEPLLVQMGRMMDLMDCDLDVLNRQGFEDWFNRLVVGLLHPELFTESAPAPEEDKPFKIRVINQLCDEMLAGLDQKFTLTQLEQKSGYSARALQYAFKERFGCGPLEWLREQRLQQARRRLLMGDYQSIAQLADACGLGAASQFCSTYKRRFGERPSESSTFAKR